MMDGLLPFFIFLAIMIFSILRKGKKEQAPIPRRPHVVRPSSSKPAPKVAAPVKRDQRPVVVYEVEKKKKHSLLQKSWQDKGSLKQAFILSEVLKKVGEREFF